MTQTKRDKAIAINSKKQLNEVGVIVHPDGDHVMSVVKPDVPNSLINKKFDQFGSPNVKGYDGWKDKQGKKRDFSSATRINYQVQTKKSIKEDIEK